MSWPLTFVATEAPNPDGSKPDGASARDTARDLATLLDGLFKPTTPATRRVSAVGTTLVFHDAEVASICRKLLALHIDVPYPQVRVDTFSIQTNSTRSAAANEAMDTIELGAEMVRDLIAHFNTEMHSYVRSNIKTNTVSINTTLPGLSSYVESLAMRPLSGPEAVLLLAFISDRPKSQQVAPFCLKNDGETLNRIGDFKTDYPIQQGSNQQGAKLTKAELRRNKMLQQLLLRLDRNLRADNGAGKNGCPLRATLASINDEGDNGIVAQAIHDLLYAYENLNGTKPAGTQDLAPEQVITAMSLADGMIRTLVERYDADIQRIFFRTLRDWIAEVITDNPGAGLSLSTTVRLSVTARMPATLTAEATSYIPFTPEGTPLTTNDIVAAASSIEGLVDQLIASRQSPTFTTLAPGVSMGIRPTVLPDGGNARLPIRLTSSASVGNPSDKDKLPTGGPIDHMQSSSVVTDLHVRAFDLFHISTTTLEHTSLGDYRWRIPVLENIPLLGGMFRGPRGAVTKKHSAMVIGTVMVLPRSVDLLRYVNSRNFSTPEVKTSPKQQPAIGM